jgi:hypothetical protein
MLVSVSVTLVAEVVARRIRIQVDAGCQMMNPIDSVIQIRVSEIDKELHE